MLLKKATIQRNVTNSVKQNFHSEDQLNRVFHPSALSAPFEAQGIYERRYPAVIIFFLCVLSAAGGCFYIRNVFSIAT
jgi:hypothetical protein